MQLLQKIQTLTDAPEGKTMHGVHFSNSAEVARHHDVVFLAHVHKTKDILLLRGYMLFQAFHFCSSSSCSNSLCS